MENTDMDFDTALSTFVTKLQGQIDEHFAKHFPTLEPTQIELEHGRKFVKVIKIRTGGGGRGVHSFIVKEGGTTKTLGTVKEGDILKAASWKQPAKHVRGTIFAEDFSGYGVTEYGGQYLR